MSSISSKSNFNSSLVRLSALHSFEGAGLLEPFQFLFGAIKCADSTQAFRLPNIFQFLFGAIK